MLYKNNTLTVFLLFILILLLISHVNCVNTQKPVVSETPPEVSKITSTVGETPPVVMYKIFEMKPYDERLRYLQHPLYSLEYPDFFRLLGLSHPRSQDISNVQFTGKHTDLSAPYIAVRIEPPGLFDCENAKEKLEFWKTIEQTEPGNINISINQVVVSGIDADYLKSIAKINLEVAGVQIYPEHLRSFRVVVFDYADLIWNIYMYLAYFNTEPPEVEEYFNHIIETFKILD